MNFIKSMFVILSEPLVYTTMLFSTLLLVALSIIDVKLLSQLYKINYKELDNAMLKKFCLKIIRKIFLASLISCCISLFLALLYTKNEWFYILIIFASSFILYLNVVCKSIADLFAKRAQANKLMFNKNLENCLENINEFKTSFATIIQSIGKKIDNNNIDELKKSYKEIVQEYKDINSIYELSPNIINESAVYNIICNKIDLAKDNGIEVDLNVEMDFTKLRIKTYELARILGILLDNAIEAARVCDRRYIKIDFLSMKNKKIIKICNTYDDKEQMELGEIFMKGYSTKKGNTGLGLWQVKRILSRHSNLDLYTYKENNIFNQELYIFNK